MKNTALLAALALLLGACSNLYTYSRPGTDAVAMQADIEACKTVMAPNSGGDEAKEAFDKCMADKGYDKTVAKYHL